jgi:hypothetical protein
MIDLFARLAPRSLASFPLFVALLCACGSAGEGPLPHDPRSDAEGPASLGALAADAVRQDEARAAAAIEALRAAGPEGLAALLDAHADAVARLRAADPASLDALRADPELARLRTAIDRVAAQRDAFASGLYWYTDLAAAEAEAARSGRPIVSLRMLGRLDEEASCANSRFFRWLLYPSPAVQEVLAGYVLHWSSERPAPHITIDMGDGRTIERTIGGNSVHYVLDPSGHVIDAIAGLHTPDDFAARLGAARALFERCRMRDDDRACVAAHHAEELTRTQAAWTTYASRWSTLPSWDALVARDTPPVAAPPAQMAMPLTVGKAFIETPMLRLMGAPEAPAQPIDWMSLGRWTGGPSATAVVSAPSRALARLKTGRDDDSAVIDATAARAWADTLQNQFTHERRLHAWLAEPSADGELASFNTRVYAELFLTPATDPWLGLRGDGEWDVMEE